MDEQSWQRVVGAWFGVGCVLTLAAVLQRFQPSITWILLVPLLLTVASLPKITRLGAEYRWQVRAVVVIWLLHAVQLLTPETGFDALWYHLPVAEAVTAHHGLVYLPALYQSVNPLFSDLFFAVGYQVAGAAGAKLVAFVFGLLLAGASFRLARVFLNTRFSLWSVIFVSLLQVVAWQSSSFYIDVAKAFWEVSALWVLLRHPVSRRAAIFAGALLGASLASKLFSILLLPVFLLLLLVRVKLSWSERAAQVVGLLGAAVLVAAPYYLFAQYHTGVAWYAVQLHLAQITQIGGGSSALSYVWQRVVRLPFLPVSLTLARDYVGPLAVIGVGIAGWFAILWKRISRVLSVIAYFSLAQLAVWWFVPPLSTRYALSGFVALSILGVYTLARTEALFYTKLHKKYGYMTNLVLPVMLWSCCALLLLPRLYVTARSLPFILGRETQPQYLERFLDGNVDSVLYGWYGVALDARR